MEPPSLLLQNENSAILSAMHGSFLFLLPGHGTTSNGAGSELESKVWPAAGICLTSAEPRLLPPFLPPAKSL